MPDRAETHPPATLQRTWLWLAGFAALSTGFRLFFVAHFSGFMTGDDVEILERAFHQAFGLPYAAWNIRHLAIPDLLVAPLIATAHAIGVRSVQTLLEIAALPFVLLSGLNIVLTYAVARRWGTDTRTSLLAAGLYSLHWLPLVFGSMPYPRTVSTSLLLLAILLLHEGAGPGASLTAGLLLGIAGAASYSEIIYLIPLLLLISRRPRRDAFFLTAAGAAIGIGLLGLYDLVTWGGLFDSLRHFATYTLLERLSSSRVAAQPVWWYATKAPLLICPFLLPPLFAGFRRLEDARVIVVIPLLILSAIHHKEVRYLQPLIPLLMIATAVGLSSLRAQYPRIVNMLTIVAIVWQFASVRDITRRSEAAAFAAQALCGSNVKAVAFSQSWAYGDELYLGRQVQVLDIGTPPDLDLTREAATRTQAVGIYLSDETAGLAQLLRKAGLQYRYRFERGRSRSVVLYTRKAIPNPPRGTCIIDVQ